MVKGYIAQKQEGYLPYLCILSISCFLGLSENICIFYPQIIDLNLKLFNLEKTVQ